MSDQADDLWPRAVEGHGSHHGRPGMKERDGGTGAWSTKSWSDDELERSTTLAETTPSTGGDGPPSRPTRALRQKVHLSRVRAPPCSWAGPVAGKRPRRAMNMASAVAGASVPGRRARPRVLSVVGAQPRPTPRGSPDSPGRARLLRVASLCIASRALGVHRRVPPLGRGRPY